MHGALVRKHWSYAKCMGLVSANIGPMQNCMGLLSANIGPMQNARGCCQQTLVVCKLHGTGVSEHWSYAKLHGAVVNKHWSYANCMGLLFNCDGNIESLEKASRRSDLSRRICVKCAPQGENTIHTGVACGANAPTILPLWGRASEMRSY